MNMVYNPDRGTWNLYNGGEWYAEGNFEQIDDMRRAAIECELEEEAERYPEPESDYYGD